MNINNRYTNMQKAFYSYATSDHLEHNDSKNYWDLILPPEQDWANKTALDFGCGKGRNVRNMRFQYNFAQVDGIDLSPANIATCIAEMGSNFYIASGIDCQPIVDNQYDFVMSTITLQHIPVHEIRFNIMTDIHRVLKSKGLFRFQMAYGNRICDSIRDYYANHYEAGGTNGHYDVTISDKLEVIDDLNKIGFQNITYKVIPSHSDNQHAQWIVVDAYKL